MEPCKHGNVPPCDLCSYEDREHDQEMGAAARRGGMKTRAEAAALIARQLGGQDVPKTPLDGRAKGRQWHYGKQELRELLDFIYGGPPSHENERVS